MKRQLFGTLILLFLGHGVFAQTTDRTVEKIGEHYNDVAEKARLCEMDEDRGEFGDLFMNEFVINKRSHQWRAVGTYNLRYKFFYKGGDTEEHMYPDQLVMVKVERKISNRAYTEEFLYSDAGVLMFYYQKAENDDQTPSVRRVYFSGLKAVRVVEDAKTRDRLNIKDAATVKEIAAQNVKIKEIFVRSIKL
ncbi:MAG: hypothetical protein ACKVQJ_15090 [Pyrinomonadaceae bacterium]